MANTILITANWTYRNAYIAGQSGRGMIAKCQGDNYEYFKDYTGEV